MRFSEYFNLNKTQPYLDFVDIPLDTDLPVFLDPTAIKSLQTNWGIELSSLLQLFFETVLKLIREGNDTKAQILLSSLNERNEFHLGYSVGKSRGHGFGSMSAKSVWNELSNSNAAVTGLLKDLEDSALMIPGIGTDMISDAVCNIIRGPLIKYTQNICSYYGIPLTDDVASGPSWNPHKEKWEESFVPLPMTKYGKVILVPKILVRHRITYNYDEYYRHYILPQMQHEHIEAHSPLIEVLRDGRERVTKKSLIKKYGFDKLAVVDQTKTRPEILQDYKDEKESLNLKPLTQEDFSEIENIELPDLAPFLNEMKNLPTGRETSTKYEDIIEKILSVILYPSLCNPRKQHNIHKGRKRIDITYTNEANYGFFNWLSKHYPCSQIFVECKNYGNEVGNPEIDQLAGRFSPSRGKVGILICRSIENKKKLYQRCIDTAKDDRGYMLVLDDDDIIDLVNTYNDKPDCQKFHKFRSLWDALID